MAAVRLLAGLALILFVTAYYAIGMLFILSEVSPNGYSVSFGVFGMLAICGPLVLLGVHLAFFGPSRSLIARKALVGALVATQLAGIGGMAPQLLHDASRAEAAEVIVSGLLSACLFGWPMVMALMNSLMERD